MATSISQLVQALVAQSLTRLIALRSDIKAQI
jgi:hypothetical protein